MALLIACCGPRMILRKLAESTLEVGAYGVPLRESDGVMPYLRRKVRLK